jgi:hypothetical protein
MWPAPGAGGVAAGTCCADAKAGKQRMIAIMIPDNLPMAIKSPCFLEISHARILLPLAHWQNFHGEKDVDVRVSI